MRLARRCARAGVAADVLVPKGEDFNDDLVALGAPALAARFAPLFRFAGGRGEQGGGQASMEKGGRRCLAIVNLKHEPDAVANGAVLIDRRTRWGNPFVVGRDGTRVRAECLARAPHTTPHAGPHGAVPEEGAHDAFRRSHGPSSTSGG